MGSKARNALDENLKDVKKLLELHAQEGGAKQGRRYGLEVLNKSAIVLLTSFWEAYCEDVAAEGLEFIVEHAPDADKLPTTIKRAVAEQLKKDSHDLAIWQISDKKWRDLLLSNMADLKRLRDRKLNTPKSDNIDQLFASAIGLDKVSQAWRWEKQTSEKARSRLDDLVTLRGSIAHRGKAEEAVLKVQVEEYLGLVTRLAAKTGGAVKKHVHGITGKDLF